MIPKLTHLYWGRNRPLSYMRLLTVMSFAHFNPDWHIHVWYPTRTSTAEPWKSREQSVHAEGGVDWFDSLAQYATLRAFNFDVLGLAADTPEVIKSDCLRWHLLWTFGGVWSDFDILYVKPMLVLGDNASVWLPVQSSDRGRTCYPVGFMLSALQAAFIDEVKREALVSYDARVYQSAGRYALERCLRRYPARWTPGVATLPASCVYPVPSWRDDRLHAGKPLQLSEATVGIHWYAGSWRLPQHMTTIDDTNIYAYTGPLLDHVHAVHREISKREIT